jgi:solute carrier family 3 protein 2
VLDLTPNIVKKESEFYSSAAKDQDWKNFITTTGQNNWKKVGGDVSAWEKLSGNNYILAQFDGYDLNMESEDVQDRLIGVIHSLVGLGVKGFRFNNAKYFLVNRTFANEADNPGPHGTNQAVGQYGFYHHHQTTYVNGLGNLLHKFTKIVHNATQGEGFFTIRDNFANNVEVFKIDSSNVFGLDIPKLSFINNNLKKSTDSAMFLKSGFDLVELSDFNVANSRIQIPFDSEMFKQDKNYIGYAAYKIFVSLLPGVQIASIEDFKNGADPKVDKILQEARESAVYQHGGFDHLISANNTAFGYTR